MIKAVAFLLFLGIFSAGDCQSFDEIFITGNANLYFPYQRDKTIFPIIGYNKKASPKLLIGGLGVGVSAIRDIKQGLAFKGLANLSRHTYWNEPIGLKNEFNNSLGYFTITSSDYTLGLAGVIQYFIGKKISVGAGLGTQVMLLSVTGDHIGNSRYNIKPVLKNRHYKSIMPVVPLEFSIKNPNTNYNLRYEYALLNKFRNELADRKRENYGLLSFEVGFKLK